MKTLIVEDDFTSRLLLQEFLKGFGDTHIAVNGREAVNAVGMALNEGSPYDLICLDIMMPELDGQQALKMIRQLEESKGINSSKGARIVMTSALADYQNVMSAYRGLCDAYLTKPVERKRLISELGKLGLISG